mmetsp:Transcript_5562/g.13562  ORF Transcript_5562/g.13562 Transcript_5562/m.13562 type:complete len:582 (+) Transcript_5562:126-1871(+)|eukprot:CAMPEP_0198340432 /NCGR_PEP_ID=MMETSP1450-20131203/44333_1 /TAXON_ID=753684 ORGANISM="Madagascaria erythrocladiodes, Strain CCMP3234" /NCGR_SAMPLE_ID=MMETSP1450 /ASSEMBLY_ACC=CAM_ASM_001115 /LENGTH=581 /DNA_ID=CAMNT_0044045407 /DNA_START=111 /DNA_END=1856 /DNA_ORIENTATION=+
MSGPNLDEAVAKVRKKADRYGELGLHSVAQFLADKCVIFGEALAGETGSSPLDAVPVRGPTSDILRLARASYNAGEHQRALLLVRRTALDRVDSAARLLVGQCLYALQDFEQALAALGDEEFGRHDAENREPLALGDTWARNSGQPDRLEDVNIPGGEGHEGGPEVEAALCYMRGASCEEIGSPTRALFWYRESVKTDLYCFQAMQRLADGGMMPGSDLIDFLESLVVHDGSLRKDWLFRFYEAMAEASRASGSSAASLSISNPEKATLALASLEDEWHLAESVDFMELKARVLYSNRDYEESRQITTVALDKNPFGVQLLLLHLASLFELGEKQSLFVLSHRLVKEKPKEAISWMAVGYYYLQCGKFDAARRFLQKATSLDSRLAAAWLAYGHTFAAQDESDQAMAAYRTASRLFPGSHLPLIYIGAEYARQSSLSHADRFFRHASELAPSDPIPLHELGVVAYRHGDFVKASQFFERALRLSRTDRADESTLFDLGHCYRRMGDLPRAKSCYERCLVIKPGLATTYTALGMVQYGLGQLFEATATYHTALRLAPDDAITATLLTQCLKEMTLELPMQSL